jgi:uncharacterized protein YbaP (TraB family)
MLFKIHDSASYLMGTLHAMPAGAAIPVSFRRVVAEARQLLVESLLEKPSFPLQRTDGRRLCDEVDAELYGRLLVIWAELRISEPLDAQMPWRIGPLVSNVVTAKIFDRAWGIESQLFTHFPTLKENAGALESTDSFFERLMSVPAEEYIERLRTTSVAEIKDRLQRVFAAWKDQNPELISELGAEIKGRSPKLYEALLADRNRAWMPKILSHVASDVPTVIAVGALHLAGTGSIPELLRKEGIDVEQTFA